MKIGLQLYSVRNLLEKDFEGTLKQISEMGYDSVEFAGYYNNRPEQIKEWLDKYNLECLSVHQSYDVYMQDFEKYLNILKVLDCKYSAIPWMDISNHVGGANNQKAMSEIKEIGKKLKENGIQMLYHNHDFEFKQYNGETIFDVLFKNVSLDILKPEFDVCWVRYAGFMPQEYIRKYGKYVDIIHLKDFHASKINAGPVYALIDSNGNIENDDKKAENGFSFKPLGRGVVDFEEIFKAAEDVGAKAFVVEQDEESDGISCLEAARISREFLSKHGY